MDTTLLAEFTHRIHGYAERARSTFGDLDARALNWRAGDGSWSVGQCLSHLVQSNEPYFDVFSRAMEGGRRRTFWERLPVLPGLWGKLVLGSVRPDSPRRARAPRVFLPLPGEFGIDIVDTFCEQQQRLVPLLGRLQGLDLDRTIVTSPVARFVTYSIKDALTIIVEHEERHLNQADRVLRDYCARGQA